MILMLGACGLDKEPDDAFKKTSRNYQPLLNPYAPQVSSKNEERPADQRELEEKIQKEFNNQTHSLEDPFVKVDPYDTSPLSGLIMFETEEPMQVQVTTGKKEGQPVKKLWDESKTTHVIPVLGLFPDKKNQVLIELFSDGNKKEEITVEMETETLPDDFMDTEVVESQPEKMEAGLTFMVPTKGYLYAVDKEANVRWYSSLESRLVFTKLDNGHYLQTTRKEDEKQFNELIEMDMLGKIHNAYDIEVEGYDEDKNNLIHHDVVEVPSGNFLATMHEPNSKYEEDHMYEIDRDTGKTTQEISLRDAMPDEAPDEYDGKNAEDNDWIHQNAIYYDETDQSILISGRSQDSILKLDYPSGELKWILAADEEWPEEYKDYLLEPQGDVKFPAGQHAVKIVETTNNSSESAKDIILFDNNEVFVRGDRDVSKQYSQAIRYRIDEEESTVEEVWSYGKNRGEDFFSHIIGNVQYLYHTDNIILNSGATEDDDSPTGTTGRIVEVDTTENPEVIFELAVQGKDEDAQKYTYRTWRYPLYPEMEWDFQLAE